jgi:mRNA degradation ribonuclease J1/J2
LAPILHSIKEVEAIILTHAHADHFGFAKKVRRETGTPVYVHLADTRMACRSLQLPWFGLLSNAWIKYTATMLGVAVANGVSLYLILLKKYLLKMAMNLMFPAGPGCYILPAIPRATLHFSWKKKVS